MLRPEIHSRPLPVNLPLAPGVQSVAQTGAEIIRARFPLLLVLLRLITAHGAEPSDGLKPVTFNVGFVRSCFLNVNRADAEAAFKVLSETVGRQRGYFVTSQTQVFGTAAEIEAAVKGGAVNLAIIDSWKYLALDLGGFAKPYFVTSEQGKVGKQYVLLKPA